MLRDNKTEKNEKTEKKANNVKKDNKQSDYRKRPAGNANQNAQPKNNGTAAAGAAQNRRPGRNGQKTNPGKNTGTAETAPEKKSRAAQPAAEAGTGNRKTHRFPLGHRNQRSRVPEKPKGKIRIIPLGGLSEIGKNMTVIEYEQDIIIVDCGVAFPDEDMPGVDLVIPDVSYLEANQDRIRGLFITHGHEDHIGAIPYILRSINPTIYATRLTLGIIKNKLEEQVPPQQPKLVTVNAGDVIQAGQMSVEFIRVNHSIADACCLAIRTPLGTLIHTGDFKLDLTPIEGDIMNITRLGELGQEGVLLLMCESTNAERPGYTPSERKVGNTLDYLFQSNSDKRLVIATFSSNVHRVQQVINLSAKHGRKVAVSGRSMLNILSAATELGYMKIPDGTLIDITDVKRYKPEEVTLVTTGSQGEPMSALYRMAFADHSPVTLGPQDVVVLSASAIPGNEKTIGRIINELSRNGVHVVNDPSVEVHVSGHACQEELKLMQALTRPKYFMPVHGEYRHLAANRELALSMGMEDRNIFISEIGKVLEIDADGARFNGTVPSGVVLVDGNGVGEVGNIVLRDRLHLSQDGMIVVVATISADGMELLSQPDIISRGFVYVRESEDLMEEVRQVATDALNRGLNSRRRVDRMQLKNNIKDDLTKFLLSKTKRRPMIIPIITYI